MEPFRKYRNNQDTTAKNPVSRRKIENFLSKEMTEKVNHGKHSWELIKKENRDFIAYGNNPIRSVLTKVISQATGIETLKELARCSREGGIGEFKGVENILYVHFGNKAIGRFTIGKWSMLQQDEKTFEYTFSDRGNKFQYLKRKSKVRHHLSKYVRDNMTTGKSSKFDKEKWDNCFIEVKKEDLIYGDRVAYIMTKEYFTKISQDNPELSGNTVGVGLRAVGIYKGNGRVQLRSQQLGNQVCSDHQLELDIDFVPNTLGNLIKYYHSITKEEMEERLQPKKEPASPVQSTTALTSSTGRTTPGATETSKSSCIPEWITNCLDSITDCWNNPKGEKKKEE